MKPWILAALALISSPALAQSATYHAQGTEPFWSLGIDTGTMRFEAAGERPIVVPAPKVIIGFAGEIYRTPQLDVNVVHRTCSDGMSDRRYPDTVTVTAGRRTWHGCGGGSDVVQPRSPIEGDWRVQSINGRSALSGPAVTMHFRGDRISGSTGCNAYGGNYRFERGVLTAGMIISTKRACIRIDGSDAPSPEGPLLQLLQQPLRVIPRRDGRLVLSTRDGGRLVLVPSRR